MSEFLTKLEVELKDENKGTWVVKKPLIYRSDILNDTVVVSEGFETDFASVPRLPLVYAVFGDTAHAAAVVHDALYTTCEFSRKQADKVLKEAMVASGIASWRATAVYAAVRLFGASNYGRR